MDTAVSPFYFLANGPRKILDNVSDTLATREQLGWRIVRYAKSCY